MIRAAAAIRRRRTLAIISPAITAGTEHFETAMNKIRAAFILTLAARCRGRRLRLYGSPGHAETALSIASQASAAGREILYYRDPTGAPFWSATPKNDAQGRAYLPVYDDAEPKFDPPALAASPLTPLKPEQGERKILYYRNPMGLPDISPVPKKDSMGMNYIPVYEGDEPADGKTIKVSLDRVQRSGVRTEPVESRVLVRSLRALGTVAIDERRATIVTMRSEGYIEDLFVNTTGQHVRTGEPLFRVYSSQIQQAQTTFSSPFARCNEEPLNSDAARPRRRHAAAA